MTLTQEQKELAISKARAMLRARMDWARNHRSNSYSAWGNDQCISRTSDAIDTMVNDTASSRRWQYWFNVLVVM